MANGSWKRNMIIYIAILSSYSDRESDILLQNVEKKELLLELDYYYQLLGLWG